MMMDGDAMIDMRCWVLKLILRIGKKKLRVDFIELVDHKITSRKGGEGPHILNDIDTLDT